MERDRFVAFAFAAADLLVEVDEKLTVMFASGAAGRLGVPAADTLVGRSVLDLVPDGDLLFVGEVLRRIPEGGRIEPVTLRLRGHDDRGLSAIMGGCRLPGRGDRYFLAFTFLPSAARTSPTALGSDSGLPSRRAFEQIAEDQLRHALASGVDPQLTFVVLEGLARLRASGEGPTLNEFYADLGSHLRAVSLGGESVGEVEDERFAVMHSAGVRSAAIVDKVTEIARSHVGERVSVAGFPIDLDPGALTEDDAVRALLYSIRRFSEARPEDLSIDSLTDSARSLLSNTLQRIAELRSTIERQAFDVVYQPIVEIESGRVHHFEALSRLVGYGSTGDFILFAEEIGLIEDFDLAVCQIVLERLKEAAATGWTPRVAVNLSARTMESPIFLESLEKVIQPFDAQRRQLLFELTETAEVRDFTRLNRTIQQLRQAGQLFCLDDIGAGGTSFQSLHALQVDFVKLDGRLVHDAAHGGRGPTMLENIARFCTGSGSELIAERIEGETEEAIVRQAGIRYGQGFKYGRPSVDLRGAFAPAPAAAPGRRGGRVGVG